MPSGSPSMIKKAAEARKKRTASKKALEEAQNMSRVTDMSRTQKKSKELDRIKKFLDKRAAGKGYDLLEREQLTTKIIQDALGNKDFNPGYKKGGMVKKAVAKKSKKMKGK